MVEIAAAASGEYVAKLLAAARRTIEEVRHCWAVTAAEGGGVNARPVMPFAAGMMEDEWTRCFLAYRDSRKAAELRHCAAMALAYQQDGGDAYVTLVGRAQLIADPAAIRRYWRPAWDAHSPEKIFVVLVQIERIEPHIRRVTPDPFGFTRTVIERDGNNGWHLVD
jgi:general stress protein 26